MDTATDLQKRFHRAMLDIYHRAKSEAGYNATRFLHMVGQQGGLRAAQSLLASDEVSDGYTELYLRGRLDLTVEAMILDHPQWAPLFTDEELAKAKERLEKYGYSTQQA